MPPTEKKTALIVVRTYPTPASQGIEVSCTAAITNDGKWLRLFPIPWRLLDEDQRFRKYQWIEVSVTKASDVRPESYKLTGNDPIKILSEPLATTNHWQARKEIVLPLRAHCLCCLKKQQQANGFPTLGIFRPHTIKRLVISAESADWSHEQKSALSQADLFRKGPVTPLEKVPYKFSYEFRCDHPECREHTLMCTDWEMGQSWRRWRDQYGDGGWEEKFRQRYETQMIHERDTHFYVGTIHRHPDNWIIVGLFYPTLAPQSSLFS